MTEQERIEALSEAANRVSVIVGQLLIELQTVTGYSPEVVLAGAHAQIITTMAATLGGPMTAMSCNAAAAWVQNLPSFAAASLATATPLGTA